MHQTIHPRWNQSLPYSFIGRTLHTCRQQILLPRINHQPQSQVIRRRWQPYKKGLSSLWSPTKRRLHIQINILQRKKGFLHSPNFIRPSTRIRIMDPDGNRNEPYKMLPCTMHPSNVQNQLFPKTEKTNFHLPTSKRSKVETNLNLHLPTSYEVGWTCLTHALEPPTPKNANSMVQFKKTKRSTSNDIWTKFEKVSKEGA